MMLVFGLYLDDLRGVGFLGLLQGFKILLLVLNYGVLFGNLFLGRVIKPVPDHLLNLMAETRVNADGILTYSGYIMRRLMKTFEIKTV